MSVQTDPELIEVMDCLVCGNETTVRRNEHDTIYMTCLKCKAKGLFFKVGDPCHRIIGKMIRKIPLIDAGQETADQHVGQQTTPRIFGRKPA